jgi:hypothetical protein
MKLFPLADVGIGPTTSIAIVCHTCSGGGIGFNGALLDPTAFLLAQISHFLT